MFREMVRVLGNLQRETMTPPTTELVPLEEKQLEILGAGLPVTRQDLETLQLQKDLLTEFFRKQLRKDIDYGVIPGTKQPSLFQPGAQKLARLFGLTVKKTCTHREVDREGNYATFTYRADVYHPRTREIIAQCEGSTNSQEKKWATRYSQGAKENTPITDILNTLQKMAQKRAFVGGVIEAVGASDFFTQDIDSPEDAKTLGIRPEPTRVKAEVPKTVSAHRSDESEVQRCDCGNVMMISNFNEAEWYCTKCKAKKPRN